jgi:spoIIIJ-associated protein
MTQTPAGESAPPPENPPAAVSREQLEEEGEIAADYLEDLLDIADLDGDLDIDVRGERAVLTVVGEDLGALVGPGGRVLDALQDLTRLAVWQATGSRSHLMLDIGGHRARRREELTRLAQDAVAQASATGEPQQLPAMTAYERKVVHDAVAAAGLSSASEGAGVERRVVVRPQ